MRIRPFEPRDVGGVASLWQFWFRDKTRVADADLVDLVRRIYVGHPHRVDGVTSLVAEGDGGAVLGFLGVTVTPVLVDGEPAAMAGVFPSVLDPDAPTAVASLLLRTLLRGPQVFTFSDGGHLRFERIWETLGGRIAQLQSLRWIKPFRPTSIAVRAVTNGSRRPLRPVLLPLAAGADWVARRAAPARLRSAPPEPEHERERRVPLVGEPLTPAALVAANVRLHRGLRLRPAYTEAHMGWLFGEMMRLTGQGAFTATLVRDPAGGVAGWYVYYLQRGGLSRVFAFEAEPRHLEGVVDYLFAEAEAAGAGALSGRMEPRLRRPMELRGCLAHLGGSLMMVHARDAALMDDAMLGRAAVSRLDGENWIWWGIATPPAA